MADFKFVLSNSVVPDSSEPMGCDPPGSSVHWILQEEYWGDFPFPVPGDLLNPGIWTHISCISCIGKWIFFFFLTTELLGSLILRLGQS